MRAEIFRFSLKTVSAQNPIQTSAYTLPAGISPEDKAARA
jgi:hypothetical protein